MRALYAFYCLLLLPSLGFAHDFPYSDPFYATLTAAILKADHKDASVQYEDYPVTLIPERNSVPYYGAGRNKVELRFWPSRFGKRAPLLVFIAGLGGNSNVGYFNFLADRFSQKGFHVLAFPSPFNWNFALAASRSGYPGVTRTDAKDLYELIRKGTAKVTKLAGIEATSYGLLGVSMGALHAAYLSELDGRKGRMKFQRTLLINPPVNPLLSGDTLDYLDKQKLLFSPEEKKDLKERVYLFGSRALFEGDIKDPAYFLNIETRLPTTLPQRQYLIGNSLKDFLKALIFTTQQVTDLGVLQNPVATTDPNPRLEESSKFSFKEYLKLFFLPGLAKHTGRQDTIESLMSDVVMQGVDAHLRADQSVRLMHNSDDFILNRGELDYLKSVFGNRATFYPYGGHVGSLWFRDNLEAILATFADLPR